MAFRNKQCILLCACWAQRSKIFSVRFQVHSPPTGNRNFEQLCYPLNSSCPDRVLTQFGEFNHFFPVCLIAYLLCQEDWKWVRLSMWGALKWEAALQAIVPSHQVGCVCVCLWLWLFSNALGVLIQLMLYLWKYPWWYWFAVAYRGADGQADTFIWHRWVRSMLSLPVCLPTQIRAGVVGLTGIRVKGGGG